MGIRPFIGAKNFNDSRAFYTALGFTERVIDSTMSLFTFDSIAFYLQRAYVKDWVDNTMIFWEVDDVEEKLQVFEKLNLQDKYTKVKLSQIVYNDWGKEFFLHDPSGVLWHIGNFKKS